MVHSLGVEHFESKRVDLWLVPACHECNCLLGRFPGLTVTARRSRIKATLRRRYAKILRLADWTEEEMAPMGRGMQDIIRNGMVLKLWVKRRIAW